MPPTYDYECGKCGMVKEEIHSMSEHPNVVCHICDVNCVKLIGHGSYIGGCDGTGSMYDFIDVNTTGKPIRFQSKKSWRNHLKSRGLTDDICQGTPKASDLKPVHAQKSQHQKRKEYKESVAKVLKEKGILQKYGK